jgi:hypothetical protein
MPFSKGKFGPHSTGEKGPKPAPVEKSMDKSKEMIHGKAQEPHGGGSTEEHITKTQPGVTQPHPVTGVHAFHAHHAGGGKYTSHTHHDGGEVEKRDHGTAEEMHQAHQEAMPGQDASQGSEQQVAADGDMGEFGDSLMGIGGGQQAGA